MTAEEFRTTVRTLGLRQKLLAQALGVAETTVYRWSRGKVPVPRYAELCLSLLAKLDNPTEFLNSN